MKNKSEFPRVLYVFIEREGVNSVLIASESIDGIDGGLLVGKYTLSNTYRKNVTHELVGTGGDS